MKYIFVDFEMNPLAREYKQQRKLCGREIIQIGAVMLDDSFQEISMFKRYVKPEYSTIVYKKFEELTGISTAQIVSASHFREALLEFLEWCGPDDYEIYAWSASDRNQMEKEMQLKEIQQDARMQYMFDHWMDFQKIFMEMAEEEKLISLEKALNACGIPFCGRQHDALNDARNTSLLFIESKVNDITMCICAIKEYMNCAEEAVTLGEVFNFASLELQLC